MTHTVWYDHPCVFFQRKVTLKHHKFLEDELLSTQYFSGLTSVFPSELSNCICGNTLNGFLGATFLRSHVWPYAWVPTWLDPHTDDLRQLECGRLQTAYVCYLSASRWPALPSSQGELNQTHVCKVSYNISISYVKCSLQPIQCY